MIRSYIDIKNRIFVKINEYAYIPGYAYIKASPIVTVGGRYYILPIEINKMDSYISDYPVVMYEHGDITEYYFCKSSVNVEYFRSQNIDVVTVVDEYEERVNFVFDKLSHVVVLVTNTRTRVCDDVIDVTDEFDRLKKEEKYDNE